MDSLHVVNLSKHEMKLTAAMRGVKIEKSLKKGKLFKI